MTELEKCMAGEWYDCHDKVFLEFKNKTHRLLMKYNSLPYDHKEEKRQVLKENAGQRRHRGAVVVPVGQGDQGQVGQLCAKLPSMSEVCGLVRIISET